jgi:soluble lytic murein transglycosylase-like protein
MTINKYSSSSTLLKDNDFLTMKFSILTTSRFIQWVRLYHTLALTVVAFSNSTSLAADPVFAAFAAYQLRIEHAAAFQLKTFNLNAPAIAVRTEPVIPLRFANRRFAKQIDEAARKANLDPALVHAVIAVESAYNQAARSTKGAIGLMQVLPETALRYGVADPAISPEANLRAGTRYLSYLMGLFDNRFDLVLAAYNAGENAVLRYGLRIPPFRETQQYVPAVLAKYREWQEPVPSVPPASAAPAPIHYIPGTRLDFSTIDAAIFRSGDAHRAAQR